MRLFILPLSLCFFIGCSPLSNRALTKTFKSTEEKFHDHVGFVLYDLKRKQTVFDFNGAKYFTPASNTKIFTLFASLKILGDSIPGLKYAVHEDSLIFWGTGDPSFLYNQVYTSDSIFNFLKSTPHQLYFSGNNFDTEHFGPGWAWDDYNDYYSTERCAFPVYGNITTTTVVDTTVAITPAYFQSSLAKGSLLPQSKVIRDHVKNQFVFFPSTKSSFNKYEVPIKMSNLLTTQLLSDTLNRLVVNIDKPLDANAQLLHSIPADSLYRVMMQDSDNFIAEQLLLMCAGVLSDTLRPEIAINYVKRNFLNDLKDEPVWKDGSGMSRYNLFTPRSIVQLWEKIYHIVPQQRLFSLLAIGGKKGTIKNYYHAEKPYIFGKTGSLSNNHCLSGYLTTKKGEVLIFSFMNNNFINTTAAVRNSMQHLLKQIYEKY